MKGKHFKKIRWNKKRIISAILSVTLLLGCISFSTLAWLTNDKDPVVNKFTGSSLEINLTGDPDEDGYLLVPGVTHTLTNDEAPKLTVVANSVDCYLFLVADDVGAMVDGNSIPLIDENGFLSALSIDGSRWMSLSDLDKDIPNVFLAIGSGTETSLSKENVEKPTYYVPYSETETPFSIINGNKFTVNPNITKEKVHPDNFSESNKPYLKFTAYSIQRLGFEGNVLGAWEAVKTAIENENTNDIVLTQ